MKKISVIIPAYNRAETIRRSVESVLNQTYPNIEILVVNDGSTDNTGDILDEIQENWGKQNPKSQHQLLVIHTENQGVSMARNEGLKVMTGEYVGFVDSDDYIEATMYEKLIEKAEAEELDIVACETEAIYPMGNVIISSRIQDGQDSRKLLVDAYTVLWNKIYRRELLEGITFKENVWYEDVLFLFLVYPKCHRVGSIADVGYYYVQNEGSITYTYNEKLYQLIENMDDIIDYYEEQGLTSCYLAELEYSYVRYLYGTFMRRLMKSKDFEKVEEGRVFVEGKVKEKFPKYKKNPYIKEQNFKSIYLRYFGKRLVRWIYKREKNRMN